MEDVIIIGGGVIGCSIAQRLAKYELKISVIEKQLDVAEGASKANSGIVHAGYNEKPGSLKAKLCKAGNEMMSELAEELSFDFKRNGAIVVATNNEGLDNLKRLKENGEQLGIKGLKLLNQEEVHKQEPYLKEEVKAGLYAPTSGLVNPYEMTLALAEHAALNQVNFYLGEEVVSVKGTSQGYEVSLSSGEQMNGKVIINAAGLGAEKIRQEISGLSPEIVSVKGEYCLYNRMAASKVKHTLFQVPSKLSKGVVITPTTDGNMLVGPNAVMAEHKATSREGLDEVLEQAGYMMALFPKKQILTTFAGLRAKNELGDFIIEEDEKHSGFIHVMGIDSPGLTAAPAIGKMVEELVARHTKLKLKEHYIKKRERNVRFNELPIKEQNQLIEQNPAYGKVICRCEFVTEGEIIDAIHRPLGARTIDGIKRRTHSTLGGCQGTSCLLKVAQIIARELGVHVTQVQQSSSHSPVIGFKKGE